MQNSILNIIGEGTLHWATSCRGPSRFFFYEKKINIFHLMHISLFLKVQIFLKKFIFYTFFLKKLLSRWAKLIFGCSVLLK